jgi:glycosyltransferase involved in cell wall biosynthesis
MPELVSILIPAYNSARWLKDSVGSALAQTWTAKEVIVVDDGSTDNTLAIAQSFAAGNVKVVSQPNGGAPSARNHALRLAQGDHIQWLDADDVLHPEKIARQMRHADPGRESRTLLTCAWGRFFFRTARADFRPDSLWQDHDGLDWVVSRFMHNTWMNPAVWLVSRHLTELAGPWDERLGRSGDDDGEYVCRLAVLSNRVKFVKDAECYFRIGTAGSLSWNKETNEAARDQLMLSLQLSIRTLLEREDSPRTRTAALSHLQAASTYCLGSGASYFERLAAMAKELGADLVPPRLAWKYAPLELLCGSGVTNKVMRNWRAVKLIARRRVDWYLYQAERGSRAAP